jgi:hypothetical protein
MELTLRRFNGSKETTLGLLYVGGAFQCFTLEDQYQTKKVYGETRIPAGTYEIKLRREGGKHARYNSKFSNIHRGMLHITNVEGFSKVLIHIGNRDDDTAGCVLVGDVAHNNVADEGMITSSRIAYLRLYPLVADAILSRGEKVTLKIVDPL